MQRVDCYTCIRGFASSRDANGLRSFSRMVDQTLQFSIGGGFTTALAFFLAFFFLFSLNLKVMYRRARTAETTPQVQRCVKVPPFHVLPDPFDRRPRDLEPASFVGEESSHRMLIPEAFRRPPPPISKEMDGPPEESFAALLI